ncbi:MAG: DEAD/DEAH box helicase family protein [Ignavibacteria bacterium]|nr:DEAD/DEAH box helicase family protein [Ignavibacteria bacterium]
MPIHVALPLPRLEPLTYGLPDGIHVQRGCRVLVPLGTRIVTGTVVAVDQDAVPKMRHIIEVLDEEPSFSDEVLELTKRISEYYLSSWGEVLQAALPTGLTPATVLHVTVLRPITDDDLEEMELRAPKRARLLRELREHEGEISVSYLQRKLKATAIADQLDALQRMGWIRLEQSLEQQRVPRMVRAASIAPSLLSNEEELRAAFDFLDAKAPKQSLALGHIYLTTQRDGRPVEIARLADELHVSSTVVDSLERRGFVEISQVIRRTADDEDNSLVSRNEAVVELTAEQATAVERITELCDMRQLSPVVLYGVIGSGKTIVYQRAIQHVIEGNGRVLLLVPEISLTPQLADRFRAVFGDRGGIALAPRCRRTDRSLAAHSCWGIRHRDRCTFGCVCPAYGCSIDHCRRRTRTILQARRSGTAISRQRCCPHAWSDPQVSGDPRKCHAVSGKPRQRGCRARYAASTHPPC